MTKIFTMCFLICSLVLSGCATTKAPEVDSEAVKNEEIVQKKLELSNTLRYQQRLDSIAYPILRGGYGFCNKEVTSGVGMRVANADSFSDELRNAAETDLGLGKALEVLWVVANSPADKSGIFAGDQIIAINGKAISGGKDGLEEYKDRLKSALENSAQLKIRVFRNGGEVSTIINPDKICSYPAVVALNATPNAYADGSMIVVNSGLLRLFEDDRDVAIVLGHELAHNVKGHASKGILPAVLGALVEVAVDIPGVANMVSAPFSPPLEAEADYVGLYIAANSGVDIEGAENVWRKFAAEFSGAKEKTLTDTHPPTPERYIALRKTVQEIKDKMSKHLPLVPNK